MGTELLLPDQRNWGDYDPIPGRQAIRANRLGV